MISIEKARESIETQVCPWCGAGPFRALANHTFQKHGVTADELRELAYLPKHASTVSPEKQENLRNAWFDTPRSPPTPRPKGHTLEYSEAGLARRQEEMRRIGSDKVLIARRAKSRWAKPENHVRQSEMAKRLWREGRHGGVGNGRDSTTGRFIGRTSDNPDDPALD